MRVIIITMGWKCDMEYMTTKEAADLWGVKIRQVQALCEKGQIGNASRLGSIWVIPKGTSKPIDGRAKQAKCIKTKVQNI